MTEFSEAYMRALDVLRVLVFALAVVAAVVAVGDWLVRTRRISPFSPIARFFRKVVDPLLAPVERRVVRAGGLPTSAPWWGLVAVVVGGIILLTVLPFIGNQILTLGAAAGTGPAGILRLLIGWTFAILRIALIVVVISSWFRISPWSKWVRWAFVLTEPMLRPLRRIVPTLGIIDITPLVAFVLLIVVERILIGVLF